jgi:hypothetical protein
MKFKPIPEHGPDQRAQAIAGELERRIVHGLALQWEAEVGALGAGYRQYMRPPSFALSDTTRRLGSWNRGRRLITISKSFACSRPWLAVRDVLRHEIAHQLADEALGQPADAPPHGPIFQRACEIVGVDGRAASAFSSLDEMAHGTGSADDRVLARIQKLLALSDSANPHEADTALARASELCARYNVTLLRRDDRRPYQSLCVGVPLLRRSRDNDQLAALLAEYYFVRCVWIQAYVPEKDRLGRALELLGTVDNLHMASYVYDFVQRYIDREWHSFRRSKKLTERQRVDFAVGVLSGFRETLARQRAGMAAADPESVALIVRDDPALEDYVQRRHPRLRRRRRGQRQMDPGAALEGLRRGRALVVHKPVAAGTDAPTSPLLLSAPRAAPRRV